MSNLLDELLSEFRIVHFVANLGDALINPRRITIVPGRKNQRNEYEATQEKDTVAEYL